MKALTKGATNPLKTLKENLTIALNCEKLNLVKPGHPEEITKLELLIDLTDRMFGLMLSNETVEEMIAKEFSGVLKVWLTEEEMKSVVTGNTSPDDHCDSNIAMDEAFVKVMGRPFRFSGLNNEFLQEHGYDTDIINKAFSIAQQNLFFQASTNGHD